MTNKNRKNYLLTCAAVVLLSAISCFAGGILQAVCGILIAALLGLQTVKYHYGYVSATVSLVFLTPLVITAFLSDAAFGQAIVYTALLTVPVILMGLTLGFAANIKLSYYKTVVLLALIYLIGSLTNMKILSSASPAFRLENMIADSVGQLQTILNSAYGSNSEMIDPILSALGEIAKTTLTLAPAIFCLLSLFLAFLSITLFKAMSVKQQSDMSFWPNFCKLRADRISSVLFLVIFILNAFSPEGLFADATLNVTVILCGIFFVFGLSYLDWKMRIRGIKRMARRLIIIACIPLCTSFFMLPLLILVSLGIVDGLFDLRTRKPPKVL